MLECAAANGESNERTVLRVKLHTSCFVQEAKFCSSLGIFVLYGWWYVKVGSRVLKKICLLLFAVAFVDRNEFK